MATAALVQASPLDSGEIKNLQNRRKKGTRRKPSFWVAA